MELVAEDRTAEEAAEALLVERRLPRSLRFRKVILRVEGVVAMEGEQPSLGKPSERS
jgi:hypothetical protein